MRMKINHTTYGFGVSNFLHQIERKDQAASMTRLKRFCLVVILWCCWPAFSFSQLAGTYLIGAAQVAPNYTTIAAAVADLNLLGTSAPVTFLLTDATYSTAPVTITYPGLNLVTFSPQLATTSTITGTGSSVFILTGAKNIRFDGIARTGTRQMIIRGAGAANNAFLMQEHTTNVTVTNCSISVALNFTATTAGLITIGGSTGAGTGNSKIAITNNNIGGTSTITVSYAVFSDNALGGTVNNDNTITGNSINNFRAVSPGCGVHVTANGNGGKWTISSNGFFMSANCTVTAVPIYFLAGSASNDNVFSSNFIGGSTATATGTWTNTGSTNVLGIYVNAGTVTISNNTIQNIVNTGGTQSIGFVGIDIYGATTPVISGNSIGGSGANLINYNGGRTQFFGLPTSVGFVVGVRSVTTSTLTVTNNTFGNLVSNTSPATNVCGTYVRGVDHQGTGKFVITGNTMNGLSGRVNRPSYTTPPNEQNQAAIYVFNKSITATPVTDCEISNNAIYGPSNKNIATRNLTSLVNHGIYITGNYSGIISKNKIYDLSSTMALAGTAGIRLASDSLGTWTISNNFISLTNYNGSPTTALGAKYGIWDETRAGCTLNIFHNTIFIGGAQTGTSTTPSYALYRMPNGNGVAIPGSIDGSTITLNSNVLLNARTGGGALSPHYAIYNARANGWSADNNFLAAPDLTKLAYWGAAAVDFSNWQSSSSGDFNSTAVLATAATATGSNFNTSVFGNDLFVNMNTDLHIKSNPAYGQYPFHHIAGRGKAVGITTDIDNNARLTGVSPSGPSIGAQEIASCSGMPPASTANAVATTICGGTTTTVWLSGLPFASRFVYQWHSSTTGGAPWTAIPGGTGPAVTPSSIPSDTWYMCVVTCLNGLGTVNSSIVQVSVVPNPLVATINGTSTVNVCSGTPVNLSVSGGTTYNWTSSSSGWTSSLANTTNAPTAPTTYSVSSVVGLCTFVRTVRADMMTVAVSPVNPGINTGGSVNLSSVVSDNIGAVSYAWTPCNSLNNSKIASPVASPPGGNVNYTLVVYDQQGCTASASTLVSVSDPAIGTPPALNLITDYTASNIVVPYVPIYVAPPSTTTTNIASGAIDDANYPVSFSSGFTFAFQGKLYSSFGINSNGFIWFGSGSPAPETYTPISSPGNLGGSGTIDGVISALGADLWNMTNLKGVPMSNPNNIAVAASAMINVNYSGTAPNRVCTIEWTGFTKKPICQNCTFTLFGLTCNLDREDFQIKLFEHNGTRSDEIEFAYSQAWQVPGGSIGGATTTTQTGMQIGLRGSTNTIYNNRQAVAGDWANAVSGGTSSASCAIGSPTMVEGTGFNFTPSSCSILTTVNTSGSTDLCPSGTVTLTSSFSGADSYQWYKDGTPMPGETAQALSNVSVAGSYMVLPIKGSCTAQSNLVEVTTNATVTPSVSLTVSPQPLCSATNATFTANPVNGGCNPTYLWKVDGVDITGIQGNKPTYTINSIAPNQTVQVVMTSNALCKSSAGPFSSNIIQNTPPNDAVGVDGGRCGSGTVTISATVNSGETVDWYGAVSGGSPLPGGTGTLSYTTPFISANTVFYAQTRNPVTGCISANRTAVNALINSLPLAPTAIDGNRCGAGVVNIGATPGVGETIDWYSVNSGGSVLPGGTGTTTYTTPSLSVSTIYYAESRDILSSCKSLTRTVVNANINTFPNLSVTNPPGVCAPTTVDITDAGGAVTDLNGTTGTYSYFDSGMTPITQAQAAMVNTGGTYYIRKTTTEGCQDTKPVTVTINLCSLVWTGIVNNDWNIPGNWNLNTVPSSGHNVFIPSTADLAAQLPTPGVDPVILTGGLNGNCNSLYLYTGANLTIQTGKALNVYGNWQAETSAIIQGEGAVIFSSLSGAKFINGSTTFPRLINNNADVLTISSGMQTITRVLGLQQGILAGNNRITLASDASNTGLIDNFSIGFTGSLTGNITANRHIAGARGYRYLSNPINVSAGLTVLNFGPSVSGANGVIYNPNNPPGPVAFPTCWVYNENDANAVESKNPQWGWVSATTAATTLQPMKGYAVIISGTQTLSYTGPANTGGFSIPLTYTVSGAPTVDGSNLVGNPYPSPISWNAITALAANAGQITNVVKRFSNTTAYTGQYADWNGIVGTNGANDHIALGQGFFVKATPGGTSFSMQNSVRVSQPGTGFFEEAPAAVANSLLRLKIRGEKGADEAVVYIDHDATDGYDLMVDAPKMLGTIEGLPNLYTRSGDNNLSINAIGALDVTEKEIPLDMVITAAGQHSLEVMELANFDLSTQIYLEDRSKGLFYDLRSTPVLALDVQEGTSSGRFFLHLGEAVSGVDERMANRMFSIFPNPADDVLSLQWNAEGREQAEQVSVHDATGRLVMQMDASAISSGSRMNLPVKLLAAGAYQVSLSTKNGRYTRTFIVRH